MTRTASSRLARAALLALAGAAALAAEPAGAQGVLLQLHPRAGDTLHMQLEQQVEMTGTMRVGEVDSTRTVRTTLHARTHSVVEWSDAASAVLVSTTDSVHVSSTGGRAGDHAGALGERARQVLEGRQVRLRVSPDGTTEVLDRADLSPKLQAFFSQMPATLPRGRVAVGDSWTRQMAIPAPAGTPRRGAVSATFRLDSLDAGNARAYVSVRGTVTRDALPDSGDGAARVVGAGALTGTIVIDRRRGWLADARTTLTVNSTLTPPSASRAPPMHFRMRVVEWLRAVDAR